MSSETNNFTEWLAYLRTKPWAWALGGILIMYIFFHVAQGLIVVVGGSALGLYLYNLYGRDGDVPHTPSGMRVVRGAWSAVRHVGDSVLGEPTERERRERENFENFDNYRRARFDPRRWSIGDMLWRSTRR